MAIISYDKRAEVSIEGIGKPDGWGTSVNLGKDLTLSEMDEYVLPASSKIIITEASVNFANEDWIKFSVKGNVYDLVTGGSGSS